MICIEVYTANQTGEGTPIATLCLEARGKKVKVETEDITVKDELSTFLQTTLALPKQGLVSPDDTQLWMESLPIAQVSIPYWFKKVDSINDIIEEDENGNEEEDSEEGDEDGLEDSSNSGGADDSDNGDGGLLNTNG